MVKELHNNIGAIRTFEYDEVVSFCEVSKEWGQFSNMSSAFPVEYNGEVYPTSEHLYISGLFPSYPSIREDILAHPNAMFCKRKFRSKAYLPFARADWDDINVEWMKMALNLKYQQNPDFRRLLEDTGDKIILEDSTTHTGTDPYGGHSSFFWGAKDLKKREAISSARREHRKKLKAEGLSPAQVKKRCKELKYSIYNLVCDRYIGRNVMGLLLTELRDNQGLTSVFS